MSAKRAKALRAGLDPDFHELLVQLSKTASATTQRNLLAAEVQSLRLLAAAPPSKSKASKSRLLVRAMFCEMMGFDTSDFAYLQAVTLCQDSRNLFEKRLAHLVAAIFMQSGHELSLMMTNTLQRDLCSSNVFEVAMALGVVAATATTDMIPSLVRFVEQCLKHDNEMIRRKALLTLHHFYRIDPEAMQPYIKKMKRCLADPHPGVMSAALVALHTVVLAQPSAHGSLAPAVVHILRQILEHRLDVSYNLHGVPAPFEQVNCMRLLALFEPLSAVVEDAITQTLLDALHKVDTNQQDNVAYMVMLQCVETLAVRRGTQGALREVWEMLLRLFQSESGIDQHVAIEGIIVLAKQRPDMVRGQEHGLIAAFEEHGDDTVLRHGILTALESMCSDTDAAVALVPLFVAHIRSLVGEGNMALQAQVADGLLAHVQRYPGMDPVAKSKALLDAFAELSDPCRRRLTNTIRVWAADGMLSKEMGVVYALGWLADEALPSHKIWLAVWMCGHWRAVQAVDALTGVLELARQHDATVDPELVAHTIETSMRLCTLPGAAFGFAIVAAVRAFEGSGNIAVANRVRQFMEAATANGAFTKPSATF